MGYGWHGKQPKRNLKVGHGCIIAILSPIRISTPELVSRK